MQTNQDLSNKNYDRYLDFFIEKNLIVKNKRYGAKNLKNSTILYYVMIY